MASDLILKQQDSAGIAIQIKLVDGRELQVVRKGKKIQQVYSIDILSLQDKSKKMIHVAWTWLLTSIIFFGVMLLLLEILPSYLEQQRNLYLGLVLFTGLAGTIFSFTRFWKQTNRKQVFLSRNSHVPVVSLKIGKPSSKAFSEFISRLEKRINKFREHMNVPEDKQLTGEMKMLRRLSDQGVISKKDYENAKEKLFSGFDSHYVNKESEFK